jgi:hypothetical protein
VAIGVGLCDDCNPLGLRDVAASQVHGTVVIMVLIGFVALALVARLAVTGVGPFPATIAAIVPAADGLDVTIDVTNEGTAEGRTTCRLNETGDRGGGARAFVLSPELAPGERRSFTERVTTFGDAPVALDVACQAP